MSCRSVLTTLVVLLPVLAGCGYTLGYRFPDGIKRVAIPLFKNETFPLRREVEVDLTRAVRQALQLRTDADLTSSSASADLVVEGTVLSFREAVLTEGQLDSIQESSLSVQVKIRAYRPGDGSVVSDQVISDHVSFSQVGGESLEDARREAIAEIAERIIAVLEYWEPAPELPAD